MIEVRKLIPKYYNQSHDFSIFMGELQILLNQLDQKSRVLEKLPIDSILPPELVGYEALRSKFRFLLKNKGTVENLLYCIGLCSGDVFQFDEEKDYLASCGLDPETYLDRDVVKNSSTGGYDFKDPGLEGVDPYRLIYFREIVNGVCIIHINLKDRSKINYDLLNKLEYYFKPVDVIVKIEQAKLSEN